MGSSGAKWTRRAAAGAGLVTAGVAFAAYRKFPFFFRQYAHEMSLPILPSPRVPNLLAWPDKGFHAAWLGHSTVLMKLNGYTVLTDPVFSDRAGLDLILFTAGVKRIVAPAVPLSALPPIDLILISHAHMDHLDTPTLKKLENKRTEVIMAPRTSDLIREKRFAKVTELMWDEEGQAGPVTVRAFEVNHWGARMQTDTYRGYNGYTLEAGGRRILFAGDTAITDAFRSVRAGRPIDLAIMPIGAYNPWIRYHCNPEQAWLMGNDAGAEFFMPVHHKTFRLSREPEGEPIERFVAAAAGRPERVVSRGVGEEFHWS